MKFLLEKLGAAVGVHQIFSCIAVSRDAKSDGATLERRSQIRHALPVRMIERFGDAQKRGQAPRDPLLAARQRRIRDVMSRGN